MSSFALSVEVLLTVSVCEVGLRGGEVFSHVARLLSSLLAAGQWQLRSWCVIVTKHSVASSHALYEQVAVTSG